jgi:hypothetical protein
MFPVLLSIIINVVTTPERSRVVSVKRFCGQRATINLIPLEYVS